MRRFQTFQPLRLAKCLAFHAQLIADR